MGKRIQKVFNFSVNYKLCKFKVRLIIDLNSGKFNKLLNKLKKISYYEKEFDLDNFLTELNKVFVQSFDFLLKEAYGFFIEHCGERFSLNLNLFLRTKKLNVKAYVNDNERKDKKFRDLAGLQKNLFIYFSIKHLLKDYLKDGLDYKEVSETLLHEITHLSHKVVVDGFRRGLKGDLKIILGDLMHFKSPYHQKFLRTLIEEGLASFVDTMNFYGGKLGVNEVLIYFLFYLKDKKRLKGFKKSVKKFERNEVFEQTSYNVGLFLFFVAFAYYLRKNCKDKKYIDLYETLINFDYSYLLVIKGGFPKGVNESEFKKEAITKFKFVEGLIEDLFVESNKANKKKFFNDFTKLMSQKDIGVVLNNFKESLDFYGLSNEKWVKFLKL